MKIKSCQKACAAVPKEADCSTLFAPLLSYRRNRSISFSPPPPYRNYGACLSLFLGRLVVAQKQRSKMRRGRETMALFSRFVPTLGFGVFRFVFGSLDLWAYTPKSPIPSLLSLLPSKMKYCRRLWISEAAVSLPFCSRLKMTSTLLAPRRRSFPPPSDLRSD